MSIVIEWIVRAAVFCGLWSGQIFLAAALLAALMGVVIFYLQKRVLSEEKWAKYLGMTFLVFAVQYLLYSIKLHPEWLHDMPNVAWPWCLGIQGLLLSAASPFVNYLLLATAISLMGLREQEHVDVSRLAVYLLYGSFFVQWLWSGPDFARIPDACCSFVILVFLGWALYSNFRQKRPTAGLFNFVGAFVYGLLKLAYGFLPLFLETGEGSKLLGQFQKIAALQGQGIAADVAFESLLSVAMFLMEVGLFLGGFLLIQQCLLSLIPYEKEAMRRVTHGEVDFLSDEGLPKYLCDVTGADESALLIWLPGKENKALKYRWPSEPKAGSQVVPMGFENWIRENRFCSRNLDKEPALKALLETLPKSFVGMPIQFHGQAIGCIYCGWNKKFAFTSSTLVRVRQLAASLAQVVHTRRQQAVLEKLGNIRSSILHKNPSNVAEELLGKVLAVLKPHGAGIFLPLVALFRSPDGNIDGKSEEEFGQFRQSIRQFINNPKLHFRETEFERSQGEQATSRGYFFTTELPDRIQRDTILLQNPTFHMVVANTIRNILEEAFAIKETTQLELELARSDGPALLLHEFRNQTASLSLGLSNLESALSKEDIPTAEKRLARLKSTLQKAGDIARAKIDRPNVANKDHFTLGELLALVETRYKQLCASRGIAFRQEIPQPDTNVNMDLDAVFLALSNLVSNAIDATGKGDSITLISGDHEGLPALHVVNTGTIPTKIQSRLFGRGYTTKASGTGLGLPLCQAAIRREGGDMFLSHSKENQTKFTITLKQG